MHKVHSPSHSLKIGIVTGEYPPQQGGVGDFSHELALGLATLGHQVHVLTHQSARSEPTLTIHPIVKRWGFLALARIRQIAASIPLDIVNIQYQAAAYGLTAPIHFLPRLLTRPSVVTLHDLRIPYLFPKAGRLRRSAVNMLAQTSGNVIVTNFDDHFRLEREGGIRRFAEIPIGSNISPLEFYGGSRKVEYGHRYGLDDAKPVIGYFGFLSPSKGARTLLQALSKLPDFQLLLVGGQVGSSDPTNAAYVAEVDSLMVELGVQDRVHRTGYLSPGETSQALLACDLMTMPYGDGASLRRGSLMACLAHGLPTVTTYPTIVVPELQDRQNIYFVAPREPNSLAQAVQAVANDSALRTCLSMGALRLAQEFTWDKIAQKTVDFYNLVLASSSQRRVKA